MKVHFAGIAGRAMGALAISLARAGHIVTGSDANAYEPMRSELASAGLGIEPFDAAHVHADLDVVIAGRRVPEHNVEIAAARRLGVRVQSFPAFLRASLLDRTRNLVVAGGVGKTTTTAMLAWILECAGLAPNYLIGGHARDLPHAVRLDGGTFTVIEGDEYAAGPGDPCPKFLHYRPEVVVLTNVLNDHPDLYPSDDLLAQAFAALVRQLPASGLLVIPAGDRAADAVARHASCAVVRVGVAAGAGVRLDDVVAGPHGSAFAIDGQRVTMGMTGTMNVRNAAMAIAAARHAGVGVADAALALAAFRGLADRQETALLGRRIVVRDKASHPLSIEGLAEALTQRFPGRRLAAVIQPRGTGGRAWTYQRDLPAALSRFDSVIMTPAYEHQPPPDVRWHDSPFDVQLLRQQVIERGTPVVFAPSLEDLPAVVAANTRAGDVVLLLLREQWLSIAGLVEQALIASGG